MTQDAPTPKSNRWTTRDVLTFVVFNLIIMAVTIVAKMIEDMVLAPQNTFFVGSWLFPLLATPFYVVMADRVGKRGVLAGSTLVFGLLYTFMGGLYCAPVAVAGALIGELVMWGKDSYHDIKRVVGGYIVYWMTFGFYGIMPYLLFRDAYMEQLGTYYDAAGVAAMVAQYTELPEETRAQGEDRLTMEKCDIKTGVFGLDPRTHLLSFLVVGTAAMLVTGLLETALLQLLAAAYLAANGRARLSLKMCASFTVVCGLSFLPLSGLYGALFVSFLHMIPPFTAGCALFTLSPSAIMCALDRWKLPQRVLVGVCMVFRFASVLSFEARSIVRGIRMRGIFPRAFDIVRHPGLAYECVCTPLVMRSLRLSSELAASAELRGIEIGRGRTSVYHVGFTWRDAVCSTVVAVICAGIYGTGVIL